MRLASLLCFYDEDPAMLAASIGSLPLAQVDVLVALDGAYEDFPAGQPCSPREQRQAIRRAAEMAGVECVLVSPRRLWRHEMAKRSALFALAEIEARADWLLVLDADERVINAPRDLKNTLATTGHDVAQVPILDAPSPMAGMVDADGTPFAIGGRHIKYRRSLFRALPGLRVEGRHCRYFTGEGRCLWGDPLWGDEPEPALDLRDLVLDHRVADRSGERREAALAYYRHRDANGVEALPA